MEQSISSQEGNASLDNDMREWSDETSVKCESRERSSRHASCIDGSATCITTEHSPELQNSINTKQAYHLQNRKTLVQLNIFFYLPHFKRKTTAAFELPVSEKG